MKARRLLEMSDLEIKEYIKSCHLETGGTLGLTHFYIKHQNSTHDLEWYAKFLRPIKIMKRFPIINNSTWDRMNFLYLNIWDRSGGMTITIESGEVMEIHRY